MEPFWGTIVSNFILLVNILCLSTIFIQLPHFSSSVAIFFYRYDVTFSYLDCVLCTNYLFLDGKLIFCKLCMEMRALCSKSLVAAGDHGLVGLGTIRSEIFPPVPVFQ